jgi:hypothetical protein
MPKDARYKAVKSLIEAGGVQKLKDIFLYIPRKTVYTDMGMNYARFKRLESSPEKFTIEELYQMSVLFDVRHQSIIDLVLAQMSKRKK